MREQPVHLTVRALQMYLDIGFKERPVICAYSRQVGQQHGYDYAQQKQDALCPGLTGQIVTLAVELQHALVPGVDGDKFHLYKSKKHNRRPYCRSSAMVL